MAIPKPFGLFIPRKTQKPVQQPDYGTDMRAIESWAKALVAYVDTLSAGGGITTITSSDGLIGVSNPTGPTTDLSIVGFPFLQYGDGSDNTGYGIGTFTHLTSGSNNSAFGFDALVTLTSGHDNTAVGSTALFSVTTGFSNTAIGSGAGGGITTGNGIVAVGYGALAVYSGTSPATAVGSGALSVTTMGGGVALGDSALNHVTTGSSNVALGSGAGTALTTGGHNTLVGSGAASTATANYTTALGYGATTGGDGSVAIGVDHTGTSAAAPSSPADVFVLGTNIHLVQFNNNHTGGNTMDLGTNSPATGPHPNTWIKVLTGGGSIGYIPIWV